MTDQTTGSPVFKLTVLAAAIGAGAAGQAGAQTTRQTVSRAPIGYTPVTFSTNAAQSISFNTDGAGGNDFTIASNGSGTINLTNLSTSSAFSGFAALNSYASPDNFAPVTSLKPATGTSSDYFVSYNQNNNSYGSNFTAGVPSYAELATNVTRDANGNVLTGDLGYYLVTRTDFAGGSSFTINDYGIVIAAAAPEPATWALMTLGFGAVGTAMRRRRRATKRALALAA